LQAKQSMRYARVSDRFLRDRRGEKIMGIDDLLALAQQRRSIRGYDESRDVADEMVMGILDCARWAPSGGNGQPWEFIVVREKSMRHKIADYYLKQLETKREMDLAVRGTARMTGDGFRHAARAYHRDRRSPSEGVLPHQNQA
jgi:nitroreductase